jgi:hypothetical protein
MCIQSLTKPGSLGFCFIVALVLGRGCRAVFGDSAGRVVFVSLVVVVAAAYSGRTIQRNAGFGG